METKNQIGDGVKTAFLLGFLKIFDGEWSGFVFGNVYSDNMSFWKEFVLRMGLMVESEASRGR